MKELLYLTSQRFTSAASILSAASQLTLTNTCPVHLSATARPCRFIEKAQNVATSSTSQVKNVEGETSWKRMKKSLKIADVGSGREGSRQEKCVVGAQAVISCAAMWTICLMGAVSVDTESH